MQKFQIYLYLYLSQCLQAAACLGIPAGPQQTHFVFKAVLGADMSHLMTDMMEFSLLLLCPVPLGNWGKHSPWTCFPKCVLFAWQGSILFGRRPSPSPSTCPKLPWCGSWFGTTIPSGETLWGRELWPSAASCLVSPPVLLGMEIHLQTQGGRYQHEMIDFINVYLCDFMCSLDNSSVLLGCFMHHSSKELCCLCFWKLLLVCFL